MSAVLLSVEEAAELEGLKKDSIQSKIRRNKLRAIKIPNATGERYGFTYGINLEDLSAKAQRNYHKRMKAQALLEEIEKAEDEKAVIQQLSLEDLTDKQRQEAMYWEGVIRDWRRFAGLDHGSMGERTREFLALYEPYTASGRHTEGRGLWG